MPCIFCKSQLHDYRSCPLAYHAKKKPMKQHFFGQAPNVFIGRHGYPRVRAGILGTESYKAQDSPELWARQNTSIQNIVQHRSELINSFSIAPIKGSAKYLDLTKEVSLAKRAVDVEIDLIKKPQFRIQFNKEAQPHGPSVPLKHGATTENVPIDTKVEKATADDYKAADAVGDLAKRGISTYFLQKAFSTGSFGLKTERKLVPTRWSITAVDDIVSKQQLAQIREFSIGNPSLYIGEKFGNYYAFFCFSDVWQYELIEHHPTSGQSWTDYESYKGRTVYAKETAGGYYAARLPLTDYLVQSKRQHSVLAIRIITDDYTQPLGVWVVREAAKSAFTKPPIRCADNALLLAYGMQHLKQKFGVNILPWLKNSTLYDSLFGQTKLTQF